MLNWDESYFMASVVLLQIAIHHLQPPHGVSPEELFSLVEGLVEEFLTPDIWRGKSRNSEEGECKHMICSAVYQRSWIISILHSYNFYVYW